MAMQSEQVPRLVEELAGKKVIGATVGSQYTAVWTESGELFTFGLTEGRTLAQRKSLCRGSSRR